MTTPRENLLASLWCRDQQWIPVSPGLTPNEHPTRDIPEALTDVFDPDNVTWGDHKRNAELLLRLGDYLGAEDYFVPVNGPADLQSESCAFRHEELDARSGRTTLSTPAGELHRITVRVEGQPPMVTERFVKTVGDARILTEYFRSMKVVLNPKYRRDARDVRDMVGDRGVLFCRTSGTPLGMCYRIYFGLPELIYLLADEPAVMGDLFACMEEKYLSLYDAMLEASPEIDAYMGMDDTSTTLISPAMFERYNVALTSARADLCRRRNRLYLHHSCGLIRDLLPVYAKTSMSGVDAFTTPPVGNVGIVEGRSLLGPGYAIRTGLGRCPESMDAAGVRERIAGRCDEARRAGHVVFTCGGGGGSSFTRMAMQFEFAQQRKHF